MENLTPNEKLKLEETASEIAYKVGEFYLYVQSCDDGYDFCLYDSNYKEVSTGVYDDPNVTLTEAIKCITEDFIVMGMGSVEDRTAPLVLVSELLQKVEAETVQHAASKKIIKAFDENVENCFAIYQLKDNDNVSGFRFEGSDYLNQNGIDIDDGNYNAIYTAMLPETLKNQSTDVITNNLYTKFNMEIPEDFKGHSLSVSDVIALKVDGNISYHFVDSFGFKEVPFINPYPVAIDKDELIMGDDPKIASFFEDVKNNPENLFYALTTDEAALQKINTVVAICGLHEQLANYHPYWELADLHSYCRDAWLKSDTASYEHIADFAVSAINENKITIFDLKQVKRSDFLYAFDMENTSLLSKNNPLAAAEMSLEENYNQIDGVLNNLPQKDEPQKKPSVLKALKDMSSSDDKPPEKKQNEIDR